MARGASGGACSEAQELLASLAQPEPRISQSFQ